MSARHIAAFSPTTILAQDVVTVQALLRANGVDAFAQEDPGG